MPPPRNRTVVRPSLFLAPVLRRNDVSDFSGLFFDSSSVVTAVIPRRPGVRGLYILIPILQSSFQHSEISPIQSPAMRSRKAPTFRLA